ncbi:immunoglobulin-like domain-containing protein, partial [Nocardioides sp.]|uniref:immunoglobulin-like domain-containing protein n=1 Tax=Nocardioides sp. TaxID=35761 RepID=UPI0027372C25
STITTSPGLIGTPDGASTHNFLGRSAYAGDRSFQGRLRDVRIYSRSLTPAEAAERALDTSTTGVDSDTEALSLGDTSAVTGDLDLPVTGPEGSRITWESSAPAVVAADGTVTRPAFGEPDVTLTVTATLTRGLVSRTKDFEVTVLADLDDASKVQQALAAIQLVHADDVRGNLTLPEAGSSGVTFSWASDAPGVVSPTGEVTRPAHGEAPVDVVLTVTGELGEATDERTIVVHVRPMPAPLDPEAYAFAYFAGESTADGEKIYFAASQGNDPLAYDELNDGAPLLESDLGEKGLRDPFLIRSPEGDRFYLVATDLRIFGGNNFGQAQQSGSKHLMIWESTDLVNWSEQRMVKVSSDFAGNTWAPEAFYDEESGQYVVYWASNLYDTTEVAGRNFSTTYNRMMYATTRDFVTFSEAQPWIDVRRGAGRGMIDSTVVQDGDTFYRMTKDEASMTTRQEKSTDLLATVSGSLPTTTSSPGWQLIKEHVGVGQPNPWGGTYTNGEGPTIFPDNEVDDRWYMFIDQPSYHGGQGYLAFVTDDLGAADWRSVPSADLPTSPRHGTVIPVSQAELDTMREAWQPDLLISSLEEVAVSTRPGVAPALPAGVSAVFGDGSTGEVEVDWDELAPEQYAEDGSFVVEGTVRRGAADRARAQVTVVADAEPTVTVEAVPAEPDGESGWWVTDPLSVVATAEDDAVVASVELSVDDGPWVETTGDRAEAEVTGDGEHTVRARAHDTTGNTSATESLDVRVDATAPVSRASLADRTVTVRAADATSGVAGVEYRLDGGAWTAYAGGIEVGDDPVTVDYRARDAAGNVEPTNTLLVPAAGTTPAPTSTVAVSSLDTAHVGQQVVVRARVSSAGD